MSLVAYSSRYAQTFNAFFDNNTTTTITIFLFDALKQTESMLNVRSESVMETNVKTLPKMCLS